MADNIEVRRARVDEREEVIRVADTAFSANHRKHDFATEYPYVWSDERMADNWLALIDGQIAGIVGSYPFTVRMAGVDFRAAGIGQVCTLPDFRGRGSMSRLLKAVTADLDGGEYDFAWLWGDRQRYGRHGWTPGGQTVHLETFRRYLPEPPDGTSVELLDLERDLPRIRAEIDSQPYAVGFTDRELAQRLGCPNLTGAVCRGDGGRDAWAVYEPGNQPNVLLAGGDEDALLKLLAYLAAETEAAEGDNWKLSIHTGPHDSTLMRVARRCYWRVQTASAACFRLCDPAGYFSRAAKVAARGPVAAGSDELSIRNVDNGLEVRLRCEGGEFSVEPKAGKNPVEMTAVQLSEAVFDLLPPEVRMPALAADSPLRALFEVPAHVSHLFAL